MTEKVQIQKILEQLEELEAMTREFVIEEQLRMARKEERRSQKEKRQGENKTKLKASDIYSSDSEYPDSSASDSESSDSSSSDSESSDCSSSSSESEEETRNTTSADKDEEGLDDGEKGGRRTKLHVSDIYPDDSGSSDGEPEEKVPKSVSVRRSSSRESRDSNPGHQEAQSTAVGEELDSEPAEEVPKRASTQKSSSTDSRGSNPSVNKDCVSSNAAKIPAPLYVSAKDELNKILLSRHDIAHLVHRPDFETIVRGCFVKIGIGNNNGDPVYRVGEVIGVCETGEVYDFENTRTNKGLMVRHAAEEQVFSPKFVSNQQCTDSEFFMWKKNCSVGGISVPTSDQIERKRKDLDRGMNIQWTEGIVAEILQEKARFKLAPHNYAMKKVLLIAERDDAHSRGDDVKAGQLNRELRELEEKVSCLEKRRNSTNSNVSSINDRNRKKNIEEAEKVIMEEVRVNKRKRVGDPFTRRSTRPRVDCKPGEGTSVTHGGNTDISSGPIFEDDKENIRVVPKKLDNTSLFNAHNFDIKIELGVPMPVNSISVRPQPLSRVKDSGPRRSLSLDDYKKKRGLI